MELATIIAGNFCKDWYFVLIPSFLVYDSFSILEICSLQALNYELMLDMTGPLAYSVVPGWAILLSACTKSCSEFLVLKSIQCSQRSEDSHRAK